MTDQPATQPIDCIRITWNPTPPVKPVMRVQQRITCPNCDTIRFRTHVGTDTIQFEPSEQLCGRCSRLAAYAALPWWRRAFTRKPKP